MSKFKKLWILFSTTFSISATTSGGWAIVAVMKEKFVKKYNWLTEDEMLDLTSIAQSTPGPVAVNASLLCGYHVCDLPGALITLFGTILPPLVIMSLLTIFYEMIKDNQILRYFMKGMSAGVAALLTSVAVDLFIGVYKKKSILSNLLMLISFIITLFFNISYAWIALFCGICGILKVYLIKQKSEEKN